MQEQQVIDVFCLMKKIKHLNWLYALLLLVAGMTFASCSEDNEMDIPPVEEEVVTADVDDIDAYRDPHADLGVTVASEDLEHYVE